MLQFLFLKQSALKILKGMRNNLFLILLFCFFLLPDTGAQKIHINAFGEGYENAEIRFYAFSDPVTLQPVQILKIKADDKSHISVDIDCNGTKQLIIKTGIYSFILFVEGSKSYNLSMPRFEKKTDEEETDPFFQESKLIPEVINDTGCLNNLISDFEAQFNSVYDSVSARIFYNRKTNEIPLLIENLNKFPVTDSIRFYSDYVRYKKSMLELMTFKPMDDKIRATHYLNDNIDFSNPAYTELIQQLFNGYLKTLSGGNLRTGISMAIYNASFLQLKNAVMKDSKISNDQLLEYVILLNLYEEFYSNGFEKGVLIKLIDDMTATSSYPYIRTISAIVSEKVGRFLPGSEFPSFKLINTGGDTVSSDDFKGKYILLSFARSNSYTSLMEFSIIKMWQNKYEKDLKLLTILTDNDFEKGVTKLRKAGYIWELLNGSDIEPLLLFYEIKILPTFILLDREGRVIMAPCLLPSEELELMIFNKIQGERNGSGLVK
jgi:hypothetical protein